MTATLVHLNGDDTEDRALASTSDLHEDDIWAWPCPYCRASNALEAGTCRSCGAQLRDPDEDDLFTTVATDNAQVIDPDAPRVKESLWSTEAPSAEEVIDAEPVEAPAAPEPEPGPTAAGARGAPPVSPIGNGPFSASRPTPKDPQQSPPRVEVFGASGGSLPATGPETPFGRNPFAAPVADGPPPGVSPSPPPGANAPFAAPAAVFAEQQAPYPPAQAPAPPAPQAAPVPPPRVRPTPDPHGLSVAVESLAPGVQEECAVPIAVCGALLGDQEVVLGILTGHLLGHAAVVVLTSTRVIVANARRWEPLVDVFHPGADLVVHTRHDRDVASLTFVQGDRLTGVDGISEVAAALEMAERIRSSTASA